MKFYMLFGHNDTPIYGELTIAHNEAFFASEDGSLIKKMRKPEIENMTPNGMTIKGFVTVGTRKGVEQFEIHEWRCNLSSLYEKATQSKSMEIDLNTI